MAPHEESEQTDRKDRKHHCAITKDRFACESRQNVRRRAHAGKNRDVTLGMAEEPEQVLPENRRTAGMQGKVWIATGKNSAYVQTARDEEARTCDAIEQQENSAAEENRKREQRQHRSCEPGPASERHAHQRHALRAHV